MLEGGGRWCREERDKGGEIGTTVIAQSIKYTLKKLKKTALFTAKNAVH